VSLSRLPKTAGLHGDGGGLYLASDGKQQCSWVYRYMIAGRARTMGLGPYPDVSLADARKLASEARGLRAQHIDPIEQRDQQRAAARVEAARAMTFDQATAGYLAAHRSGWRSPKHAGQWERSVEVYVSPIIGKLPVAAIDTALVLKVLQPIWATIPVVAGRIRGRIESVLDWAKARGYRNGAENPARWKGHLDKLLPAKSKIKKVEHFAALPYAELPAFLAGLQAQKGVAALALQFTILTAARSDEVLEAEWPEIDLGAKVCTRPAAHMKGDKEHRVPLSAPAIAILDEVRSRGTNGLVFPSLRKNGRGRLSANAMLECLARMDRSDLTVHGFRSTFRDWAGDCTEFPKEVAEAALAHADGDATERAYRRGDAFEKRRQLMDDWAMYCGNAPVKDNVVDPTRP
jgi:integrase